MQGGKSASAVESAKEAAANVGASAWAGKEKTKAVVQEKVAKARAHDPAGKAAADERMQERVREVEAVKQEAMRRNAAAKERAAAAAHQPGAHPALDGQRDAAPLPGGAHLVGGSGGDGAAPVSSSATEAAAGVTTAAPNATETGAAATGGHVAGAPETAAVVNDGYPTATGRHP